MYVDGYVLVVPAKKLPAYKKMASEAGPIWMKHGALRYVECVGEDMGVGKKFGGLGFPDVIKAKKGEKVVFAFVTYKSRKHRDAVNKKVHADMATLYPDGESQAMPFDEKRFCVGGFETIVDL